MAERKADAVMQDLLSRIVRGELDTGEVLPREDELAKHYGVNRSVVREAIKKLEVHDLVMPVKRRGTVVLDPSHSTSPDVLAAMLAPRPGAFDLVAVREMLEVRALLDAEMCSLAAERRSDEDLARLDHLVARLEQIATRPHDADALAEVVDELPLVIARASHNRIYEMLARWHLRVCGDNDTLRLISVVPVDRYLDGLRILVELIRQRDAEQTRAMVGAAHAYLAPRIYAAIALANGASLEEALALGHH